MIGPTKLKVCGLRSAEQALLASRLGADFVGFNVYPKSPRYLALADYRALAGRVAEGTRVVVAVEPTDEEVASMIAAGVDYFQFHFRLEGNESRVASWERAVGAERLWLAPKLPPGVDVPQALIGHASAFLVDTFDASLFGGTGRTGDWEKFKRHRARHPGTTWILSGGLTPANIAEAVASTGASFVDVNSGVESAPGIKDEAKLRALAAALGA